MMQNRLRRNVAVLLSSAALLVGVAACGTETDNGEQRANPDPSVEPKSPAPVSGPIKLTKTGGVAGVNETVKVNLDGKASVNANGKKFSCKVEAATLASLEEEAGILQANGVEKKDKKGENQGSEKGQPDGPEGDGQTVDAFNYQLSFDDKEYSYQGGEKIPRDVRPLLSAMTDVLSSAADAQKGKGSSDDSGVQCN